MLDVVRRLAPLAAERSPYPEALGLSPDGYLLATVHRESNTEEPSLGRLVEGLTALEEPVVVPAHPRLRAAVEREGLLDRLAAGAIVIEPLGLLDLTALLQGARLCLTDSGGLQKEAYLHRVPCVTLRDTSEWVETLELGWNVLVGDDPDALAEAVATLAPPERHPPLYGDGNAAPAAAERLADPAWLTAGGARAHG
jgi:UDP-N-acetylglucosamine 2-epimerase